MADNRQFTDHNEIGGVNVYLEDKKLAESPEQNTVATTDYVLLKDTDGVPHKISKANMMSVVKDALADLLKNNDLGTSVTNVPALNSSAFGSATVANLASVLGALPNLGVKNRDDVDSILQGVFSIHNGHIYSEGYNDFGIVIAFLANRSEKYGAQLFIDWTDTRVMYRVRWNSVDWSEWRTIVQ